MYTLDIKNLKNQIKLHIIATLSCILFAMIYEHFSHGVYSAFMICSFIFPLFFGVIVPTLIVVFKAKMPSFLENNLYNASVATFTLGSIINGFLEIYGTTNSKVYIYLVLGIILLLSSIFMYFFKKQI